MNWQIVQLADVPATAWRNGGGVTRELAVDSGGAGKKERRICWGQRVAFARHIQTHTSAVQHGKPAVYAFKN